MFDEAIHPENVVVLTFQLELVAYEEGQLFLGLVL